MKKTEINPMEASVSRSVSFAVRCCGVTTRAGLLCKCLPIRGRKRCRLHGGLSPGAPKGRANGNYRTGEWTGEATREREWLRTLTKQFAR